MGQRDGFSKGDLTKINNMYGCPNKTPGNNNNNNNNKVENNNKDHNNNAIGGLLSLLFSLH